MKYIKFFLSVLVAVLVMSCGDKDTKYNTNGGVTVSMQSSTFSVRESSGICNVPVVVKGDANGMIKVTFELIEVGGSVAKEDIHYYATSKTINIAPEDKTNSLEFLPIDDKEINEDRTFIVKIANVEGASVGDVPECVVTIRDNDQNPYDRLEGEWTLSYDDRDLNPYSGTVYITVYDDDEFQYERVFQMSGEIMAYTAETDTIMMQFNKSAGSISFLGGQTVASGLNFGGDIGVCDLVTAFAGAGGTITTSGAISGPWNEAMTEIDFGNQEMYLAVRGTEDSPYPGQIVGYYSILFNFKLTREP
ncbi:MAG: hypothetical protein NC336_03235 [Clostridium sp.]|nr:hypothetical protein [Clostridium sp.]